MRWNINICNMLRKTFSHTPSFGASSMHIAIKKQPGYLKKILSFFSHSFEILIISFPSAEGVFSLLSL